MSCYTITTMTTEVQDYHPVRCHRPRRNRSGETVFAFELDDSARFHERHGVTRQGFGKRTLAATPRVIVYVIRLHDVRSSRIALPTE